MSNFIHPIFAAGAATQATDFRTALLRLAENASNSAQVLNELVTNAGTSQERGPDPGRPIPPAKKKPISVNHRHETIRKYARQALGVADGNCKAWPVATPHSIQLVTQTPSTIKFIFGTDQVSSISDLGGRVIEAGLGKQLLPASVDFGSKTKDSTYLKVLAHQFSEYFLEQCIKDKVEIAIPFYNDPEQLKRATMELVSTDFRTYICDKKTEYGKDFEEARMDRLKRRRYGRRKRLYNRRLAIARAAGASEAVMSSLSAIGEDAMSDDESDNEKTGVPATEMEVYEHPNRHPTLSNVVQLLDRYGGQFNVKLRGHRTSPHKRIRPAITIPSPRVMSAGRPEGTYSPNWLSTHPYEANTIQRHYLERSLDLTAISVFASDLENRLQVRAGANGTPVLLMEVDDTLI